MRENGAKGVKTLGLTGGIGMGKSTAANLLSGWGIQVADTDLIAREVVAPGQPALGEIRQALGHELIAPDGTLRRDAVARLVFRDPAARKTLESILHPRIREVWQGQVERWRQEQRLLVVVVIPLLFETGAAPQFDGVLCVACSAATQWERLRARGWSEEQIRQRNEAQLPVPEKMAQADYVLWTEGPVSVLGDQLKRVLATAGLEVGVDVG